MPAIFFEYMSSPRTYLAHAYTWSVSDDKTQQDADEVRRHSCVRLVVDGVPVAGFAIATRIPDTEWRRLRVYHIHHKPNTDAYQSKNGDQRYADLWTSMENKILKLVKIIYRCNSRTKSPPRTGLRVPLLQRNVQIIGCMVQ